MPSSTQGTVAPWGGAREGGSGKRSDTNLKAAFPASPIHTEIITPEMVTAVGISACNGGGGAGDAITGNSSGEVNDSGYYFNVFNLNFPDAPDISSVEGGGGGKPASPYVPNLSSPGPGSLNYADQPEYTGNLPEAGGEFGVGLGATANPSQTTPGVNTQTLGGLISGRSYETSNGTA
jgi:hypothetical protein